MKVNSWFVPFPFVLCAWFIYNVTKVKREMNHETKKTKGKKQRVL